MWALKGSVVGLPDLSCARSRTGPRQPPASAVIAALLKAMESAWVSTTPTASEPASMPVALAVATYEPAASPTTWTGSTEEPAESVARVTGVAVQVPSVKKESPAAGWTARSTGVSAATAAGTPFRIARTAVFTQSPALRTGPTAWSWSASAPAAGSGTNRGTWSAEPAGKRFCTAPLAETSDAPAAQPL